MPTIRLKDQTTTMIIHILLAAITVVRCVRLNSWAKAALMVVSMIVIHDLVGRATGYRLLSMRSNCE